uniref:ARAD1C12496p n=1 Tax=Blastobotrys adeninivorans TaxID=409370 RepID=A0A060T6A6_BLAAD
MSSQVWSLLEKLSQVQSRESEESSSSQRLPQANHQGFGPDPTEISTYPQALKYIVTYLVPNEKAMGEIRRMVQNQDRKEAEWTKSRDQLVKRQKSRHQGQQELENVLRMVGGSTEALSQEGPSDEEKNKKELQALDTKIYKSMQSQAREQEELLRIMGVPLFCMRSDITCDPDKLSTDKRKVLELLRDLI